MCGDRQRWESNDGSGEWWSAPPHDLVRTTRSLGDLGPAGLWLVEDSFGPDEAMTSAVAFSSGARVLELDGPDAWVDLCRRYPLEVTATRRHDWYRTTGRDSRWLLPDWAAVALDADAVHLTVAGYLTTAGRALDVTDGVATVLAGWDPDVTVWLNDTAIERTQSARWALDADDMWGRLA